MHWASVMHGMHPSDDCTVSVVEQLFFKLSQTRLFASAVCPHAAYFLPVHWTHWFGCPAAPIMQTPLPAICVQSSSIVHAAQVFVVRSHRDAFASLQSVFD